MTTPQTAAGRAFPAWLEAMFGVYVEDTEGEIPQAIAAIEAEAAAAAAAQIAELRHALTVAAEQLRYYRSDILAGNIDRTLAATAPAEPVE